MTDKPKHPGGRPRIYEDPQEFADEVDGYFDLCESESKVPNIAGLCVHLGFNDKDAFARYGTYGAEFSGTVKAARLRMENDKVQRLHSGNATGPIFDLKVNHGWQDKTVSELSGPNGGPIQSESKLDLSNATTEQLQALASLPIKES